MTETDQQIVEFYRRVKDQYVNQTPLGTGIKHGPKTIRTLRIDALQVALRLYDYPRELWPVLSAGAHTLHGLLSGLDVVDWRSETRTAERPRGKGFHEIEPEDVGWQLEPTCSG